jgi:hypothetical protein
MSRVRLEEDPICVRHRDGWCATYKKTEAYADSIKTVCGQSVQLPWDIARTLPDCPECMKRMGLTRHRRKNG